MSDERTPDMGENESMVKAAGLICRAVVAVVLCLTGSCTIATVFGPPDVPRPVCSHAYCTAPAAYCGAHAGSE